MKQQLESRDFQLALSKKKAGELEEILKEKSRVENERDGTSLRYEKLNRKCERFKDELEHNKKIVTDLKARLTDFGDLQVI